MSRWLKGLNPEQSEAACHNNGPLLILAGAGSGKTTVLVARSGRLVDEKICPPEKLCVLTFTNKAARELKSRVSKKLGTSGDKIWAGTFHSFGLTLLRKFHREAGLNLEFGILDPGDASSLVKETLKDFHLGDKTAYDADKILEILSRRRETGSSNKEGEYEEAVEWLLPKYQKKLKLLGMVDFDDLILKPIELMKKSDGIRNEIRNLFDQVMVDEFQDTNIMQMRLIRELTDGHKNLAVVGDDDQSIYGWRGACVSNILDFPKFYHPCKVVRLERNYRSSANILNLANSVISKNTERHPKTLQPHDPTKQGNLPELVVYEDENEEIEHTGNEISNLISGGHKRREIAVLYRSNSQGAQLEAELRKNQVPYLMSGGTGFFDRKETRDILAYLRCAFGPNDLAFRRIINVPSRGIGEKSIEDLTEFATEKKIPFYKASRFWGETQIEERVGNAINSLWEQLNAMIPFLFSSLEGKTPGERLVLYLEKLGYKQHLEKHATNALAAAQRWRYVQIFSTVLDRFMERGSSNAEQLKEFLDSMELRDILNEQKEEEDRVQLMTLHACKGLEFNLVFLMGVEEDLLPHRRLGSDLSEERRLFYVGITRARDQLFLTRAKKRRKHGKLVESPPSRFILEIPTELYTQRTGPRVVSESRRRMILDDFYKMLDTKTANNSNAPTKTF